MLLTTETPMTLKSGFREGQGHQKLHHSIRRSRVINLGLVIHCTRCLILCRLWDRPKPSIGAYCYHRCILLLLLRLTPPPDEVIPLGRSPWNFARGSDDSQGTQRWRNIAEICNPWGAPTLQTRDGPNVRLWHSAEAEGLDGLTERVPNVAC